MHENKIKRLDSEQRVSEYEIDKLFDYMKIYGDEVILDVGAGTGAFTIPLAKRLKDGVIKAVDIDEQLLDYIDKKAKMNNLDNIQTIHFTEDAPVAQQSADKIFICVVLHEISDKKEFLDMYRQCLKENGSLYIVEFNSGKRSLCDNANKKGIFIESFETEKLLSECGYKNITTKKVNELIYLTECNK